MQSPPLDIPLYIVFISNIHKHDDDGLIDVIQMGSSLEIFLFLYGRIRWFDISLAWPSISSRVLIYLLLLSLLAIWAIYTMASNKCDKIFVFTVPTRPIVSKSNCKRIWKSARISTLKPCNCVMHASRTCS